MSRNLSLLATIGLALIVCLPVRSQDSPSLGDVARQAQKDKTNKPAAKVITNDDMPSVSGGGSSALGGGSGKVLQPGAAGQQEDISSPAEGLEKIQSTLDQFDALDRASLARVVLEGNESDFPGRAQWEQKLFTAKQNFVSRGRALLLKAEQLEKSSEGIKDVQDPNDPRVKNLATKLQQLVQDNEQNSATFQVVIVEGRDLAKQAPSH